MTHASGIPGRTLWDLFLKKLWGINSFDALHVFFDALSSLLVKTKEDLQKDAENNVVSGSDRMLFSRTSPFGAFIRRAQLEFTRLQFHDGITLWKSLIVYREPTLSMWRRRNPTAGDTTFDVNLMQDNLGYDHRLTQIMYCELQSESRSDASFSTDDLEKLLEFLVSRMQKVGDRVTDEIKRQFESMLSPGITVPSLSHYVKFLDSWKAGDYLSSFDNLHRYFDYTMHNRDRTFYQYALLNLAILQADFNCFPEAIAAMQETISTARENKDMGCLNYSLSWLYHFSKAHSGELREVQKSGVLGTEKEALAFLKAKSKEASMWSLLSTSLLSEAKLTLTTGDSLSLAFENAMKASYLNVTRNVTNIIGTQIMVQSSIFSRLGVSYLAWSYGEVFLQCYADNSPVEDVLRCTCKISYWLAQNGQYDHALIHMDTINRDTLRTLKHQQHWMAFCCLLKFQRYLRLGDLDAAEQFLSQSRGFDSPGDDMLFTISILEVRLQMRRQEYSKALRLLEECFPEMEENEMDIFQRIKLLTLKARILDMAGIPQKGFSVALRAASLARRARLLPALWEAIGAVCRILISLEEFDAAAKLLRSIMPQVLECEDCELAADCFSFLADAYIGLAGEAEAGTAERKEQMTRALECTSGSFDEFSRVDDVRGQREMMAKKAIIMRLNSDLILANNCAAKYLHVKKASESI